MRCAGGCRRGNGERYVSYRMVVVSYRMVVVRVSLKNLKILLCKKYE